MNNVTEDNMLFKKQKKKQQGVTIEENTQIFIEDFKKLVDEGKKESVRSVIKFMANSIQSELFTKCMYNDRNYQGIGYMRAILNSFLLDLSFDFWQKCNIHLKVQNTPIISCVWNHSRMIDGLMGLGEINKNPFNGISFAYNIHAFLIEPLGLVVVDNGNHSVNAAIVYNEGEIIVNTVIDISEVLEKYRFDGKKYVNIETNKKVNIKNLKNNSESFTYTFGLLFEMARVLKNAKDENGYVYYDVN
ncbi:DUF6710 family protein [Mediterraneibacter faecis]|uniref:DUF6710 family protein n=2 Tax=Lachnospiraceae TaxID=186803 RepID=UPI001D08582B|nr:DUF6710 family protein [Mediterraneibacter faecis]